MPHVLSPFALFHDFICAKRATRIKNQNCLDLASWAKFFNQDWAQLCDMGFKLIVFDFYHLVIFSAPSFISAAATTRNLDAVPVSVVVNRPPPGQGL